jgi:hypothetical protein
LRNSEWGCWRLIKTNYREGGDEIESKWTARKPEADGDQRPHVESPTEATTTASADPRFLVNLD